MVHKFDTDIAEKAGIANSVIYGYIEEMARKNAGKEDFFRDGKYWACVSVREMSENFTYLTENQIRHGLKILEENGLILSGNFNEDKFDKRKWYTVNE